MTDKAKIRKVLVVLSPDLIRPDHPENSALLRRAVSLARITGCELELFHVCYESSLEESLFRSDDDVDRERRRLTDGAATRVAELATRLRRQSVEVSHETRWDHPRTDAILRKIGRSSPDLVLKQSREHNYVLGFVSNTDWELVRRSPSSVWLVSDEVDDIDRIVAAVGTRPWHETDITTSGDYDLLRTASLLGDVFKAAVFPVNAYQIPTSPGIIGATGGASAVAVAEEQAVREATAKRHSGMVRALANYFDISPDNVRIEEGRPDNVIPEVAEKEGADIIVLGARNIGRLERLVGQVTVEPVMSRSQCDILVVRDEDTVHVPEAETRPFEGTPRFSLDRAITDPEDAFDSPQQVVDLSELSIDLRQRILQAWEHDVRAGMRTENEGGVVDDSDVNVLGDIVSARALLDTKKDKASDERSTLNQESA